MAQDLQKFTTISFVFIVFTIRFMDAHCSVKRWTESKYFCETSGSLKFKNPTIAMSNCLFRKFFVITGRPNKINIHHVGFHTKLF